jgi:hypothetical protein
MDVAMVAGDVGQQSIQGSLVTGQVARYTLCLPLIAIRKRPIQAIPVTGDICTEPVNLPVIVPEIPVVPSEVLTLIVSVIIEAGLSQ